MKGFKIKDTMRVTAQRRPGNKMTIAEGRLGTNHKAIVARQRQAVAFLAENGAQLAANISRELGYSALGSSAYFLSQMIKEGKIRRTGRLYHLPGQSAQPGNFAGSKVKHLLEGDSNSAKALRWLKDHQDEPILLADLSKAGGYLNNSGAHSLVATMKGRSVLRQYKAPEDKGWEYRFQFVDPELSGVKISHIEPSSAHQTIAEIKAEEAKKEVDVTIPESWGEPLAVGECAVCGRQVHSTRKEVTQRFLCEDHDGWVSSLDEKRTAELEAMAADKLQAMADARLRQEDELSTAIRLVDKYAREFHYLTGSRDARELAIWLKERKYSK